MSLQGVSLVFLRDLLARIATGALGAVTPAWTTTEVCDNFIKPATMPVTVDPVVGAADGVDRDHTSGHRRTYIELIAEQNPAYVGPATIFVSHAWKYRFVDVLQCMISHGETMEQSSGQICYFWFDLFVNDQHSAEHNEYEWWQSGFKQCIRAIGSVLLVFSPWSGPLSMTRAWCIYEMMCAIDAGVDISVVLPDNELASFVECLASPTPPVPRPSATIFSRSSSSIASAGGDTTPTSSMSDVPSSPGPTSPLVSVPITPITPDTPSTPGTSNSQQSSQAPTMEDGTASRLEDVLAIIKAETAEAWKADDLAMIRKTIEATCGYTTLNWRVKEKLREKLLDVAVSEANKTYAHMSLLAKQSLPVDSTDTLLVTIASNTASTGGQTLSEAATTSDALTIVSGPSSPYFMIGARTLAILMEVSQLSSIFGNTTLSHEFIDKASSLVTTFPELKRAPGAWRVPLSLANKHFNAHRSRYGPGPTHVVDHYQEALQQLFATHCSLDNYDIGRVFKYIGHFCRNTGLVSLALKAYHTSQLVFSRTLGHDHPFLSHVHEGLGATYSRLPNTRNSQEQATKHFQTAIDIARGAHDPGHAWLAKANIRMADHLANVHAFGSVTSEQAARLAKAVTLYQESLGSYLQMYGYWSEKAAFLFGKIGAVLIDLLVPGDSENTQTGFDKAYNALQECLNVRLRLAKDVEQATATAALVLASEPIVSVSTSMGATLATPPQQETLPTHSSTTQLPSASTTRTHPLVPIAESYCELGRLHGKVGRNAEAVDYYTKAKDIFHHTLGRAHRKSEAVCAILRRISDPSVSERVLSQASTLTAAADEGTGADSGASTSTCNRPETPETLGPSVSSPAAVPRGPLRVTRRIPAPCKFWLQDRCRKGDDCPFQHHG